MVAVIALSLYSVNHVRGDAGGKCWNLQPQQVVVWNSHTVRSVRVGLTWFASNPVRLGVRSRTVLLASLTAQRLTSKRNGLNWKESSQVNAVS